MNEAQRQVAFADRIIINKTDLVSVDVRDIYEYVCVHACVCGRARVCMRACACACARLCVHVWVRVRARIVTHKFASVCAPSTPLSCVVLPSAACAFASHSLILCLFQELRAVEERIRDVNRVAKLCFSQRSQVNLDEVQPINLFISCMHACVRACMYACVCVRACVQAFVRACMCARLCAYVVISPDTIVTF